MPVREAIIAVTDRCNARCRMCNIWQKQAGDEVEPSYYYHLPQTLTNVNLTGGEPFLRKDLPELMWVLTERCPKVRPVISTNGLLTDRILDMAPKLLKTNRKTAFRISLDGLAQIHDEVRGIPGAFEKAIATLKGLKKIGVKDLGIGFTLTRGNEDQLMEVYRLSLDMGVQFTSTLAHSSPIFFGDQKDMAPDPEKAVKAYSDLMKAQLKSGHPKDWFRAYFTEGVIDLVHGRRRLQTCPALDTFFFLDPKGRVFPCHILDKPLGYLHEGYENLIAGNEKICRQVHHCAHKCWMTCTVAPGMRKSPWNILGWIAKAQISRIFGGRG